MDALLHPQGPEAEQTYWVRRAVVILAAVVVLALLLWGVTKLFGGGGGADPVAAQPQNSPGLATSSASAVKTASSAATSAKPAASSAKASTAAATSAKASATKASSAKPSAAVTTASPKPADGVLACDPAKISAAVTGSGSVKSGSTTTITTSLTNTGPNACRLDFAKNPLELKIYSGKDRIWTSAHCEAWAPQGKVTLKPKVAWSYEQKWPTLRSAKDCALRKDYLGPGTYVVTAQLSGAQPAQLVIGLKS